MPWGQFFTYILQAIICMVVLFIGAAVLSVIYNNFKDGN